MKVTKIMLIHALNGGKVPFNEPELVKYGVLVFEGRGNNPYDYKWSEEKLLKLTIDSLYELYVRFNS